MKKFVILSVVLNVLLMLWACGGRSSIGVSPVPTPTKGVAQLNFSPLPGFHGTSLKQTSQLSFSLVPLAYAQISSVVMAGSYSGFCKQSAARR